ncbi:hypothetical protein [Nitrobacter sp.]|uniref:hypothetical protein n=1 Tax=Nitrobacter sp. TaxID=29420 RepID=UPI0029CAB52B|nr:hypothetical protein [Nitrobacter sp.]
MTSTADSRLLHHLRRLFLQELSSEKKSKGLLVSNGCPFAFSKFVKGRGCLADFGKSGTWSKSLPCRNGMQSLPRYEMKFAIRLSTPMNGEQ